MKGQVRLKTAKPHMYTYEKSRFKSIVRIDPEQLQWLKENKGNLKTVAGFLDLIVNTYRSAKQTSGAKQKPPTF